MFLVLKNILIFRFNRFKILLRLLVSQKFFITNFGLSFSINSFVSIKILNEFIGVCSSSRYQV